MSVLYAKMANDKKKKIKKISEIYIIVSNQY